MESKICIKCGEFNGKHHGVYCPDKDGNQTENIACYVPVGTVLMDILEELKKLNQKWKKNLN